MTTHKTDRESLAACINRLNLSANSKRCLSRQLKWLNAPIIASRIVHSLSLILIVVGIGNPLLYVSASKRIEEMPRALAQSSFAITMLGFAGRFSSSRSIERVRFANATAELLQIKECEHAPPAGRGEAPRP